jgi:hypothetical protein
VVVRRRCCDLEERILRPILLGDCHTPPAQHTAQVIGGPHPQYSKDSPSSLYSFDGCWASQSTIVFRESASTLWLGQACGESKEVRLNWWAQRLQTFRIYTAANRNCRSGYVSPSTLNSRLLRASSLAVVASQIG